MLVIRRRGGESVLIGDSIEVQVIEVLPGQVTLGVLAPKEIPILRKEIRLAADANLAACRSVSPETIRQVLHRLRK